MHDAHTPSSDSALPAQRIETSPSPSFSSARGLTLDWLADCKLPQQLPVTARQGKAPETGRTWSVGVGGGGWGFGVGR